MIAEGQVISSQPTPYTAYNYAVLYTQGLRSLLDTMRYEHAFFARRKDVENVLKQNGETLVSTTFTVLLGKYDWRGPTKPGWREDRLTSWQELRPITDPSELFIWSSDALEFRPQAPLKFRFDMIVKDTVARILETMHLNKAFPADEANANALETALFESLDSVVEIQLGNFATSNNINWKKL